MAMCACPDGHGTSESRAVQGVWGSPRHSMVETAKELCIIRNMR